MSKIIKLILLLLLVLLPMTALAGDFRKGEGNKIYLSSASGKVNVQTKLEEKLSPDVFQFKTRLEENMERRNKLVLEKYKNKLNKSNFKTGKKQILVTGYSSTPDQCSGDPFRTASGTRVHKGTMACPPQYPFGTKIVIENVGTFVCEDRGGAIKGNHFDMWFSSRSQALAWGKRVVMAEIVN